MASETITSDIFKFVALRPPVLLGEKKQAILFIEDERPYQETGPYDLVRSFEGQDGARIPEQLEAFINQNGYSLDFPQDNRGVMLKKIAQWVKHVKADELSNNHLRTGIEQLAGQTLENFQQGNDQLKAEIWDRYYTFYMLARTKPLNLESLALHLRVFHLIALLIEGFPVNSRALLDDIMNAQPLLEKIFADLPKAAPKQPAPPEPIPEETAIRYGGLWDDLVNAARALEEVRNVRIETAINTTVKDVTIPNKLTGLEDTARLSMISSSLVVNRDGFQALHPKTKELLQTVHISEASLPVSDAVVQLEQRLNNATQALKAIDDPRLMQAVPGTAMQYPGFARLTSNFGLVYKPRPMFPVPKNNVRASIKPLGIGDLKVVKQTLKKYVAGEVAHIENVLRGEYKERKHRVLDRTEENITISTETEEETTKDLQTTERFELKKESEKAIQEQTSIQAGVTVSATYGPVTVGAHGEFAYSTSSQESNKSASNFAREVIDRSVSRIQKKTKEERVRKQLHEVEELNVHGIDNKDKPDHTRGIYRWVDKYYEAQIYNYGVRMMFEFIIPEPAAFYEYAMDFKSPSELNAPETIKFDHKFLHPGNYAIFLDKYNVQGALPPPSPFKTISTNISKDAMELDGKAHAAFSKDLVVPAGYVSKKGLWFDCSAYFKNYPHLEIVIGNKIFRLLYNDDARGVGALQGNHDNSLIDYHAFYEGSPIHVGVNSYDVISYTVNVYAFCELTEQEFEKWQLQTFEKIKAGYLAMKTEYDQRMAAQQTQAGVAIQGQNPRINREIERTELKKHCIKLLMDTDKFGQFNAMERPANSAPDFDIVDSIAEGRTIQFFEQAFEWENMTYLFYPYFWAKYDQWIDKIKTSDTDPLFTQFRQAGSARVVLPVRPFYNDAVMYFLENNGEVWKGGDTPRLKDDLFLSIADELKNRTDDLANATPEGDPWTVILPTTLVYLQQEPDLPTFE